MNLTEKFRYYAKHVANEIAAGEIEPNAGAEHIADMLQKALDGDAQTVEAMIAAAVE